ATYAQKQSIIVITPSPVDFGGVAVGTCGTATVSIRSIDTSFNVAITIGKPLSRGIAPNNLSDSLFFHGDIPNPATIGSTKTAKATIYFCPTKRDTSVLRAYLIFPNNQGSEDTIIVKGFVLSLDAQPD